MAFFGCNSKYANLSACDEEPKVPQEPIGQKIFKCDVSDLSVVSDTTSDYEDGGLPKHFEKQHSDQEPLPSRKYTHPKVTSLKPQKPKTVTIEAKNLEVCLPSDISVSVFESLKKQEEKLDSIQEQISRILEQKNSCCHDSKSIPCKNTNTIEFSGIHQTSKEVTQTSAEVTQATKETTQTSKEVAISNTDNQISSQVLCILQGHGEQIQKLQEQINLLFLKTPHHFEKHPNHIEKLDKEINVSITTPLEKHPNHLKTLDKEVNVNIITPRKEQETFFATNQEHNQLLLKGTSKGTMTNQTAVQIQEKTEVSKTSTSTMTSLMFEGNEKLFYRKVETVVTDYSKCSLQRSTADKEVVTPDNKIKTKASSSSRKRNRKCCHKCGIVSPNYNKEKKHGHSSPSSSSTPDSSGPQLKGPRISMDETRLEANQQESVNTLPKRKSLPSILRNVNDMIMHNGDNGNDYQSVQRISSKAGCASGTKKKSTSNSPQERSASKSKNKHIPDPRRFTSPNTSTISTYHHCRPHPDNECNYRPSSNGLSGCNFSESSTKTVYGMSSPNLSVATKNYLENYGLVMDKNMTMDKTRTCLSRHLR